MSENVKSYFYAFFTTYFSLFLSSQRTFSDTNHWEGGDPARSSSLSVPFIFASIISPSWAPQLKWKKEKRKPKRQFEAEMTRQKEGEVLEESSDPRRVLWSNMSSVSEMFPMFLIECSMLLASSWLRWCWSGWWSPKPAGSGSPMRCEKPLRFLRFSQPRRIKNTFPQNSPRSHLCFPSGPNATPLAECHVSMTTDREIGVW